MVRPKTRSFYCFGCRASGDIIDFVRRDEGLSFREWRRWIRPMDGFGS